MTLNVYTCQGIFSTVLGPDPDKRAGCPYTGVKRGITMDYARLGTTGLEVSRLCVGCMGFGVPAPGTASWLLDEAQTRQIIRLSLEAGLNFFDTANVYAAGTSEEFVGRALKDLAPRDEVVLATKS